MFSKLKKLFNNEKSEKEISQAPIQEEHVTPTESIQESPKRLYTLWNNKSPFRVSEGNRNGFPLYGGEPQIYLSASFPNDYDVFIFSRNEKHFDLTVSKQDQKKKYKFSSPKDINVYLASIQNYTGAEIWGFEKDAQKLIQQEKNNILKQHFKDERKARRKEQKKDATTLKSGTVWADKIADVVISGSEDRSITPNLAKEIINEIDTNVYESNNIERRKELLYHGNTDCHLSDMKTVNGIEKIIFPNNGYEVQYKDCSLTITNSRDHDKFSLTIPNVSRDNVDTLLSGIQHYNGLEPITEEKIKETFSKCELREKIEKRKETTKKGRKLKAKLQEKDVTTITSGSVWADKIAEDIISGKEKRTITPELAKDIIKNKAIRGE